MRRITTLPLLTLTACLMAVAAFTPFSSGAAPKNNWSQWRGPEGTGVSSETNLPAEWSDSANIKWKTPIPGRGHSSPVVWDNRIFISTDVEGETVPGAKAVEHKDDGKPYKHPDSIGADRKHTFKVLCIDRGTGKTLWERTAYEGTVYDDRHRKASLASPTPATDGNCVFAYFGTEGLYCYDFSGKLIWRVSPGQIATYGMGTGTSPVLFENTVILQCDEDNGEKSFILALDKKTGKEVWKTPRKVQASWSTPLIVRGPQRTEMITSGNELIISYDPKNGKELWRTKGHASNAIATPLAGNGMEFADAFVRGDPTKIKYAIGEVRALSEALASSGDQKRLSGKVGKQIAEVLAGDDRLVEVTLSSQGTQERMIVLVSFRDGSVRVVGFRD